MSAKASESFLKLQRRITELEESIADRRELYNEVVNQNNIRIEQFPDRLIAGFFKFGQLVLGFGDAEFITCDLALQAFEAFVDVASIEARKHVSLLHR